MEKIVNLKEFLRSGCTTLAFVDENDVEYETVFKDSIEFSRRDLVSDKYTICLDQFGDYVVCKLVKVLEKVKTRNGFHVQNGIKSMLVPFSYDEKHIEMVRQYNHYKKYGCGKIMLIDPEDLYADKYSLEYDTIFKEWYVAKEVEELDGDSINPVTGEYNTVKTKEFVTDDQDVVNSLITYYDNLEENVRVNKKRSI